MIMTSALVFFPNISASGTANDAATRSATTTTRSITAYEYGKWKPWKSNESKHDAR